MLDKDFNAVLLCLALRWLFLAFGPADSSGNVFCLELSALVTHIHT